jgi:hypothetical protein
MPRTLILNQSNIVANTGNSVFQYNFPNGSIHLPDHYIAVQQISMYNSVYNISTTLGNNTFSYTWVDNTVVNVTIPNGNYTLPQINSYLQSIMYSKTHYLVSGTSNVYFLEIVVNQPQYVYQINCYILSATLATTNSWSLPTGASWVLPTNTICPMITIPSTNIRTLLGFKEGTYPSTIISGTPPAQTQTPTISANVSFQSTTSPEINPQPSYLCLCSLVNNRYSIPNQLIYSVTPTGSTFGALYTIQVSDLAFNPIEAGTYNSFLFRFVDSLGNPVTFQDPNMLILLVIKTAEALGIHDKS